MTDHRTTLDKHVARAEAVSMADAMARVITGSATADGIDLRDATFGPISPNELGLLQKDDPPGSGIPQHDDPVGYGVGAWARPFGRLKYYLGKFRMDVLRWKDGRRHHTEVEFLKWAIDELHDNDGRPVPLFAVYLTESDEGSSDQGQQPVAIFTRRGIRFLVPVTMEAGGAQGPPPVPTPSRVTRFYTDGGKFCVNMQDDQGNIRAVKYRIVDPNDESTWEAIGVTVL